MKKTVLILCLCLTAGVACADPFSNTVVLAWSNRPAADLGLAQINTNMGFPKWDSYINGVLATNIPMTTNWCPVAVCEAFDGATNYAVPDCDDSFLTNVVGWIRKKLKREIPQ